ncbi:phosphate ABC transporter substrate-binding protein [Gemmatimonas groenlandica]|uniref:Phosphate ABC transporter substrate-binding protein n=1 Tax=Gemmatimonas groenlandica TaxID=2732249 RepID=A0A6M4ISP5_9BACT|nr:phosphate ABC transporter substrate-binding protein [Gemmatimonas groenlandica]QJR37205.1 phosphate ABC transporter substrate-binding protein [Gemmatimonas groenlandica]
MHRILRTLVVALVATVASTSSLAAQDFKVIVNSANPTSELSIDATSKLFLKQSAKFASGTAAQPVDLAKASAVRAAFSKAVLGRPSSAVETYWQQQIFSGKDVPPPAKASDDDVIAFVKANPGAIGYVSAGASTAGVKVIDVK